MLAPLAVREVVRPAYGDSFLAATARFTNVALLVPVAGAFFQLLVTHRIPSLGWPFSVLGIAFVARVLRPRVTIQERPARLGVDGLATAEAFIAAREMSRVEVRDEAVWITTHEGATHELAFDDDVTPMCEALERTIRSISESPPSVAAEALELAPVAPESAYRGTGIDAARCLSIVEDAALPPRVRIAAAELLRDHPDDEVRVRLAEVAASTANPELGAFSTVRPRK